MKKEKYLSVRYKDIVVYYQSELDGGGRGFGQTYVPIVQKIWGNVDTACEFCAGPGFIGFSLLAHGLCDNLFLADVNPKIS